jgi:osomolarity two-component system, response regulator SKN7
MNYPGLQVYTVGHLLPRSTGRNTSGGWGYGDAASMAGPGPGGDGEEVAMELTSPLVERSFAASGSGAGGPSSSAGPSSSPSEPSSGSKKLRIRRSTYVPGWAVPPRVLLVDDDAVSRKLSSKFLQVFGCTFDVAVDGVGAVNKMNLEKYDLVLMVGILFISFSRFTPLLP